MWFGGMGSNHDWRSQSALSYQLDDLRKGEAGAFSELPRRYAVWCRERDITPASSDQCPTLMSRLHMPLWPAIPTDVPRVAALGAEQPLKAHSSYHKPLPEGIRFQLNR